MRIALITGAGRREGLGFETVRQLRDHGLHVILSARKADEAEALAKEVRDEGGEITALAIDTTDADSVAAAVSFVEERFGKLDVLVNNAAILAVKPSEDFKTDLDDAQRQFATNLFGTWRMAQEFYPLLKASGDARLVNVSSGSGAFWDPDFGLVNNPGFLMSQFGDVPIGPYGLTKLAINGLTVKLSQDFKDAGILVNSVCPGLVSTYLGSPGRPVAEGARSIVWAAILPKHGPTGMFFRDGKQLPW